MKASDCLIAIGACAAVAACDFGPSPNLTGNWSSPGLKFQVVQMQLQQDGDRTTGVACAADAGVLLFSGVPVTGELPDVRFEVATGFSGIFAGTFEDDRNEIAGEYGGIPLRFKPSATGRCDGARPFTTP